jgi:hypothetical protein
VALDVLLTMQDSSAMEAGSSAISTDPIPGPVVVPHVNDLIAAMRVR